MVLKFNKTFALIKNNPKMMKIKIITYKILITSLMMKKTQKN